MHHDCLSTGARLSLINCEVEGGFLSFAWGLVLPGHKPSKMTMSDVDSGKTYGAVIPPTWQSNKDTISVYDGRIEIYEQEKVEP